MKNHTEAVNPIDASLLVKRELSTVYVGSTRSTTSAVRITQVPNDHRVGMVLLFFRPLGQFLDTF